MSIRLLALCLVPLVLAGCYESPSQPESFQASLATSAATQVPVAGTMTVMGAQPGWEWFVTPNGQTLHIRGLVAFMALDGDLVGEGFFVQKSNWGLEGAPNAGTGNVSGPMEFTVTWNGKTGVLSGQYAGGLKDFIADINFNLHGSGELEGVKWHGTAVGPLGGPFEYGGRLHIPPSSM